MSRSFLGSIPPVVKNLLAINIVFWLATVVLPGILPKYGINGDITDYLGMHYWASAKFNPAQLFTYMFMHGGFSHMFFNMLALYMFGAPLEYRWGSKRFLFYYLFAGIGAGLVQQIFWTIDYQSVVNAMNLAINNHSGEYLMPYEGVLRKWFQFSDLRAFDSASLVELKNMFLNLPVTIGASGSIFGLLLAFGWLFPQAELFMLFIPIPIKARLAVTIYAVFELFFGVANFSGDNIAHFAHLGGMLFGAILILIWKKKKTFF